MAFDSIRRLSETVDAFCESELSWLAKIATSKSQGLVLFYSRRFFSTSCAKYLKSYTVARGSQTHHQSRNGAHWKRALRRDRRVDGIQIWKSKIARNPHHRRTIQSNLASSQVRKAYRAIWLRRKRLLFLRTHSSYRAHTGPQFSITNVTVSYILQSLKDVPTCSQRTKFKRAKVWLIQAEDEFSVTSLPQPRTYSRWDSSRSIKS